ncbi:hypothetical protein [Scytonema sp. NUACC26]|uniref:hypothetical protein n=1 Tax=Scytonema sp. NUACC26 TaxID=3140176 RepID=UPI0038B388A8
MPTTLVIFYKEEDGSVPVLEWLDNLPEKAQDNCRVRIERMFVKSIVGIAIAPSPP